MGFLGSILRCSESWMVVLGSLPTKENLNLEGPSCIGSVLAWGREMWSKYNSSSYPPNVVLHGLVWGCFSLNPGLRDFLSGILSMESCSLVFLSGGLKQKTTYVAILMMSSSSHLSHLTHWSVSHLEAQLDLCLCFLCAQRHQR